METQVNRGIWNMLGEKQVTAGFSSMHGVIFHQPIKTFWTPKPGNAHAQGAGSNELQQQRISIVCTFAKNLGLEQKYSPVACENVFSMKVLMNAHKNINTEPHPQHIPGIYKRINKSLKTPSALHSHVAETAAAMKYSQESKMSILASPVMWPWVWPRLWFGLKYLNNC